MSGQISFPESVLTQRNDVRRTAVYDHEVLLTPAAVSGGQFRRLVVRNVLGQVAAQPLYVRGVTIGGSVKNVAYVATRRNYIYAFDADNTNPNDVRQGQAWANPIHLVDCDFPAAQDCLSNPQQPGKALEATPLKGSEGCQQTLGPAGITGTPVIDPRSQVMYLVARFGAPPSHPAYGKAVYHYLAALDIKTGQELRRVLIQTPPGNPGGTFQASSELNRPGLLLLNDVLYIAFGAPVCDVGEDGTRTNTHGWVFAYSLPALTYLDSYNTSPSSNSTLAGIWQSGNAPAADPVRGLVYAFTGNNANPDEIARTQTGLGTSGYDDLYHPSRTSLGESILKLSLGPGGKFNYDPHYTARVVEHFTAGNWYRLDTGYHCPTEYSSNGSCGKNLRNPVSGTARLGGDSDLGSGGPVVLSNGFVLGGGKQGRLYVLDPNDFRHAKQAFFAALNMWHPGTTTTCNKENPAGLACAISTDDYDLGQAWGPNIHGSPAVWERTGAPWGYLYLMAEKDYLRGYRILPTGQIVENAEMTSQLATTSRMFPKGIQSPDAMPGGAVSVSSNGNSSGIVWVSVSPQPATEQITTGALMAFDALTLRLLWYDDDPISFAKFVPPTIAGGKVFRATFGDIGIGGCPNNQKGQFEGLASCGSVVIYGLDNRLVTPAPRRSKVK
jgi:hypothetical protein